MSDRPAGLPAHAGRRADPPPDHQPGQLQPAPAGRHQADRVRQRGAVVPQQQDVRGSRHQGAVPLLHPGPVDRPGHARAIACSATPARCPTGRPLVLQRSALRRSPLRLRHLQQLGDALHQLHPGRRPPHPLLDGHSGPRRHHLLVEQQPRLHRDRRDVGDPAHLDRLGRHPRRAHGAARQLQPVRRSRRGPPGPPHAGHARVPGVPLERGQPGLHRRVPLLGRRARRDRRVCPAAPTASTRTATPAGRR